MKLQVKLKLELVQLLTFNLEKDAKSICRGIIADPCYIVELAIISNSTIIVMFIIVTQRDEQRDKCYRLICLPSLIVIDSVY